MIQTSALYKSITASRSFSVDNLLEVYSADGATFVASFTEFVSLAVGNQLYKDNKMSIGSACSAELSATFRCVNANDTLITLPKGALLRLFIRVKNQVGTSEYIPQGVFFIDKRSLDPATKTISIIAYDSLLKSERVMYDNGSITWSNQTARTVAQSCATAIGVTLENPTAIPTFTISAPPTNRTIREILCDIAIASCGNFTIAYKMVNNVQTPVLRFVPLVPTNSGYDLGQGGMSFDLGIKQGKYTHVTLIVGYDADGKEITSEASATTDNGLEYIANITIFTNSAVTAQIASTVLQRLGTYEYQPYTVSQAYLDPSLELGDGFTAYGTYSVLASRQASADSLFVADISAPMTEELESEYPYETPQQRDERIKASTKASIKTEIDSITMEVENNVGGYSKIVLKDGQGVVIATSDNITLGGDVFFTEEIKSKLLDQFGISQTVVGQAFIKSPLISSSDQNSVAEMTASGWELAAKEGESLSTKVSIGYKYINNYAHPYILLGAGTSDSSKMLLMKFGTFTYGGVSYGNCGFFGNSAPLNYGMPTSNTTGFMVDYDNGTTYKIVNGNISELGTAVFG